MNGLLWILAGVLAALVVAGYVRHRRVTAHHEQLDAALRAKRERLAATMAADGNKHDFGLYETSKGARLEREKARRRVEAGTRRRFIEVDRLHERRRG